MNTHHHSPHLHYFDPFHIAMIILPLVLFAVLYFLLRKKSQKVQYVVFYVLSAFSIILFIAYKIYMSIYYTDFAWIGNLPFQLCNINLLIIPFALIFKSKTLYGFLFYISIIGAFIGVTMFDIYFVGRNPFSFAVLVYFLYHAILVAFPLLLVSFKIYTPNIKDIFKSIAILFSLAFIMFLFNLFLIKVVHYSDANYFYTMGMPGNPLMDFLWKVIPVPFLFFVPIAPILFGVNYLMTIPFFEKKHKKEENI